MSLAHSPSIVTDGLITYLDAGNIKSYTGSGITWVDLSGLGFHGTLTNGLSYNSSGYMSFDGIDDYVSNPSTGQSIKTVISWVKITAISDDYIIFGPDSNGQDNWLGIRNSKIYCLLTEALDLNNVSCIGNTTLLTDIWYQIACTIDTNTFKVYLNGIEDGSSSVAFTIGSWTGTSAIGRQGSLPQRYFSGNISSLSLYNRVLSASEVRQNFNSFRGRYGI